MKKKYVVLSVFVFICTMAIHAQLKHKDPNAGAPFTPNPQTNQEALTHFADEKFGVMITWGPYTLTGQDASWSMDGRAAYESYYTKWKPKAFNADEWGRLFKTLDARYLIWVAKHHDGLCLWDTKTTDNNIMELPYHENITADFAKACKKYGIDFGTYLSIIDAHDSKWNQIYPHGAKMPGFPEQVPQIANLLKAQALELVNEYHPFVLWFDGGWLDGWRSSKYPVELENTLHKTEPKLLITRLGNHTDDFESMEAKIGTYKPYPWETVTSVAYPRYSWGTDLTYKSVPYLIETLCRVVCGNGNYLLSFIPDPDGRIPQIQQGIAKDMGRWVHKNAKAIFGTRGGPYYPGNWGGSTRKGNKVYLYLLSGAPDTLLLPRMSATIVKTKVITGGNINIQQTANGLHIDAPVKERDAEGVVIVELTLDQAVSGMIEASKSRSTIKASVNSDVRPIEDRNGKLIN